MLALASLSGAGYAAYNMKSIDDTYSRLIDHDARALTLMLHNDDVTNDMGQKLWNAVAETDASTMKSLQADFNKEAATELAELDKGIQDLPKYKDQLQKLRDLTQEDIDGAKPVFTATIAQDKAAAIKAMISFQMSNDDISDIVSKAIVVQTKYVNDASNAASNTTQRTIYTTLSLISGSQKWLV